KVNKYLGRVVQPQRTQEVNMPELIGGLAESLKTVVAWELQRHGFAAEGNTHRLNSVTCSTEQKSCLLGDKPAVLLLNNGHLCNETLHELLSFRPIATDLPEETNGRQLAFALVKAGMAVPEEVFVQLVEKAVKELGLNSREV
ncbi:MAG: hypothetical protein Q7K43_06170, partial [Candidatus Woesearchaeota archaeon]|nr:hypothetical protein [Candidatus Woesearchaeota archaeon]